MSNRVSGDPDVLSDPMSAREAQKYEFPVPSREAVLAHLGRRGEPLSFKFLASELGVEGERDLDAFGRRLRAMERDGQLLKNRRGRYGLLQKMDMVRGRVVGHPDGFGFLVPDEGGVDLFLPPKDMRIVLHGDRVVARVAGIDARGRREGTVVEVLERANPVIVGRYSSENRIGFVVPADKRISQEILIPHGDELGARDGQIVVAAVSEPPTFRTRPVGRITEVLGDHMAPGMEVEIAIRTYDLPHSWPDAVLDEVSGLAPHVPPQAAEGREDLRDVPLVTIDGEDARDFDDAVFCEREGRGFRLVVAIADVSAYVLPGSALDAEAYRRGNSVYFPNHVIPMLPEILSNGLCSINPGVDWLCVACEMHIGAGGRIRDYRFFRATMRSHARFTYTEVAAMLADKDADLQQRHAALLPRLRDLHALYSILHRARIARGAVDFELPETRIIYDAQRRIDRIEPLVRNDAHRLIEECMLAANVSAADLLSRKKKAVPFRVHAGPTAEKLAALREFLSELGLDLGGGDEPSAHDYTRLLQSVEGRPEARLVHTVMLRSLSQAIYTPENTGHFALGYPSYAHFTSPIRRYPDLLVHRAIMELVEGRRGGATGAEAQEQGDHLSMTERRADEATRDVVRWLKTEFMVSRVGEEFDGIISSVTNFGLFVELVDIYVDGLVHITALGNDYYHFDAVRHRLVGDRTRRTFRLGDPVRVRVVRVDLEEAKIDFELADPDAQPAPTAGERPARKARQTSQRRAPKTSARAGGRRKAPRRAK